jgi:N-acetylmuramoyl-L-alanine amidase
MGRLQFYWTDEPGTPFSFFQKIFWNRQLDLTSVRGQQIFRHEYYHVRKGHSADILYLEVLRVVFWCNPFFHLICREIKATHEFQADRYALSGGSPYDYAELLVWQAVGVHTPPLTHPFFNTHLKRRINMLTKSKTNRPGYLSRLLILPLLFLLFCAFAIRLSKEDTLNGPVLPAKTLTVVIDAGHGGFDAGTTKDGILEKDLNLAIAKKIKQFSATYNVNVLMTRESDIMAGGKTTKEEGLRYRTDFANGHKADLYVSVHVNSKNGDTTGGVGFYLSKENSHYQESSLLGSVMIEEMKKAYPTDNSLHEVLDRVYVLRTAAMPAVLIECGSLDNPADVAFITQEKNQDVIAKKILQGIVDYQQAGGITPSSTEDVHPAKEDKLFMNQWYMDLNRLVEKKVPGKGC